MSIVNFPLIFLNHIYVYYSTSEWYDPIVVNMVEQLLHDPDPWYRLSQIMFEVELQQSCDKHAALVSSSCLTIGSSKSICPQSSQVLTHISTQYYHEGAQHRRECWLWGDPSRGWRFRKVPEDYSVVALLPVRRGRSGGGGIPLHSLPTRLQVNSLNISVNININTSISI